MTEDASEHVDAKVERKRIMTAWGLTHDVQIADKRANGRLLSKLVYKTKQGAAYWGDSLKILQSNKLKEYKNRVQMVFTSPPFPLNTKKSYGNLQGDQYVEWFAQFSPLLRNMITENGSIVVEIGNAWMPGKPVMSTHVLKAFLRFLEASDLNLCQEFIWYNPARLPSPIEWVNKERIRVKDAFTRIWWMSPSVRPKADNRRILREYSASMKRLIKTGKYNAGLRPSEHNIGAESFAADNSGAIPPNVGGVDGVPSIDGTITPRQFEEAINLLKAANTMSSDDYRMFCLERGAPIHPARMPTSLVEFFVKFLTEEGDTVLDPFAGSNTTGAVTESLGRRWLSIEADWIYATNSIGRFDPTAVIDTCNEITVTARDKSPPEDAPHAAEASSSSNDMPLFTS